jgi:hypothetical protein
MASPSLPPAPCRRCTREDDVIMGRAPSTVLMGLSHRRFDLALDDERALALFFATFPPALEFDTITYRSRGPGHDPQPVFVSGLALIKYAMWAEDHAVGDATVRHGVFLLAQDLETAVRIFPEARVRFPWLAHAGAAAQVLYHGRTDAPPLPQGVWRLIGVDWGNG